MIKIKRKDIIMTKKTDAELDAVIARFNKMFRFELPEDPREVRRKRQERARSNAAYSRVKRLMKKYADLGLGYDLQTYGHVSPVGKWVYMCQEWEDYIDAAIANENHPAHEDAYQFSDGRYNEHWDDVERVMLNMVEFASEWADKKEA